jgi:uncharacterized membrane protein
MSNQPSFVVVTYKGRDTAAKALAVLDQLSEEKQIKFDEAVTVYKNEKGKIKIDRGSKVITTRKGGVAGGVTGLIIGTLIGGPVLGAALGAATGATAGKFTSLGGDVKKQLNEELGPNDSALCVVIKEINWSRVLDEMGSHKFGGKVVVADLAEGAVASIGALAEDEKVVETVAEELSDPAPPTPLTRIKGIGPAYAKKLKEVGVLNTEDLLEKGASRQERAKLAKSTEISEKLVLRWVNLADLFRIRGIGEDYAYLLEAAGVDTVPELAGRNPENLHQKLGEINAEKKLVHRTPGQTQVVDWVDQARVLPRKLTY